MLESSDVITTSSRPFGAGVAIPPEPVAPLERQRIMPLAEYLGRQQREYILRVLQECAGCVTRAAKALGLDRSGLHRKLKRLGIPPGAGRSHRSE